MKVKQSMPASQPSSPSTSTTQSTISSSASSSTINNHEKSSSNTNAYESLPSYEDHDVDLPLEQDELLQEPILHPSTHSEKIWQVKGSTLTLSALEATVAVKKGLYTYDEMIIYTPPALSPTGPSDPVTGALSAAMGTIGTIAQRASDYPLLISKVLDPSHSASEKSSEIAAFANDPSKGVTGIVGAGLRAPMDLTVNVSRGFHNLPMLYGDKVREVERVEDVKSGLQAAGKGFGFGLWDGLSGLVTQPIKGVEEGGLVGGLIGFGKGIGGAVFKPAAGAINIPASLFQGIYEEVQKPKKVEAEYETREAQMLKGFREWDAASEEERKAVFEGVRRRIEDLETWES